MRPSKVGEGVAGVEHEIEQRLLDLAGVAQDRGQVVAAVGFDGDFAVEGALTERDRPAMMAVGSNGTCAVCTPRCE